MVVATAEI